MAGVPFDPAESRPFAPRGSSMYLDTLRKTDLLACQVKEARPKLVPTGLLTQDIEGATPYYPCKDFWSTRVLRKDEVEGAAPKGHYPDRNRAVDLGLVCVDIEKAQPNSIAFDSTRRTDPLVPNYKLPRFQAVPPEEPTTVAKDLMRIEINTGLPYRDPLWVKTTPRGKTEIEDIEFARPNYLRRVVRPLPPWDQCRDPLKTQDINGLKASGFGGRGSRRHQNPLEPEYEMAQTTTHPFYGGGNLGSGRTQAIGPIEGNSARLIKMRDKGEHNLSLFCGDIPGASSQRFKGQKPFNLYDPPEVTPIMDFHDPRDIQGAQAGSRLRRHGRMANNGSQTARERVLDDGYWGPG